MNDQKVGLHREMTGYGLSLRLESLVGWRPESGLPAGPDRMLIPSVQME